METFNDMECKLCSIPIPTDRTDMGYTICTNCSTEEKKVGHIIYPHKTGAYIQVVDRETHNNLNRLDRRGARGRSAKSYKKILTHTTNDVKPKPINSTTDNIVHIPYDIALRQVMDYYDEWGYERTIQYLRRMNCSGDIPLMTRVKIQDVITDRYLNPSPRALRRKFMNG